MIVVVIVVIIGFDVVFTVAIGVVIRRIRRGRRGFAVVFGRHVLIHLILHVESLLAKMAFKLLLMRREMALKFDLGGETFLTKQTTIRFGVA